MDKRDNLPGTPPEFTVSQAVAVLNQVLATALPYIDIVGEVANYKVNQGKWVFFDLKDKDCILNCFMSVYNLRVALEDGMKVKVRARPSLTKWGRFSMTVQLIKPVGEGSIKKSFELLKKKLTAEGLFDQRRKRLLPKLPQHIGAISSVQAAGYADFIKILGARMSGLTIDVISVQVQGDVAADQIISAIHQMNELPDPPEVLAILRGGGSRDDLAVFDDEKLVRAIAASRIPTITGIGHEIDTTLADLASDLRASTPSNAAELLVPDRRELLAATTDKLYGMVQTLELQTKNQRNEMMRTLDRISQLTDRCLRDSKAHFAATASALNAYNPRAALKRGYALVWAGEHILKATPANGDRLTIETATNLIETEVRNVRAK